MPSVTSSARSLGVVVRSGLGQGRLQGRLHAAVRRDAVRDTITIDSGGALVVREDTLRSYRERREFFRRLLAINKI